MGEVYAGLDEETGSKVALKFVGGFATDQAQAQARLRREVELARQVEHPNVCRVYDLATHQGETFCVMELLEGATLAGPFRPEEVVRIALQLCDGLAAAHAAGVVHRDLKPGNIFLEGDRAVIIDFGLAAAAAPGGSLTAASAVMGTIAYMSPEQLEGAAPTARSDLYSLGVVLYEILTGRLPHGSRSPFRLAAQKAREAHCLPGGSGPALPAFWDEVLTRCLKARPELRYASAAELRQAIVRGRRTWGFVLSRRRVWIPAAAALAGLLGWSGYSLAQRDYRPRQDAARLYEEGLLAVARGAPFRGVQFLEQAVERDPSFVKAWALVAVAHCDNDQIHRAREAVLRASEAADRRWLLGRGERAALRVARSTVIRDFAAAAGTYRRLVAVSTGGERTQAQLALGDILSQAGQTAGALETFESVLRADPANAAARLRLATLRARGQDRRGAARDFDLAENEYRRQRNEEGLADLLLARAAMRLATPEEDRRDAQTVAFMAARGGSRYHYLSAQFLLANAAVRERRYEVAAELMGAATEQAQHEGFLTLAARAQSEFGYLFLFLREPAKAEPALRTALRMAEQSGSLAVLAEARMRLGEACVMLGRAEEAVAHMQPAIEWFRGGGFEALLPLMLIKWGTAIPGARPGERTRAFEEALARSTRNGDEVSQCMALQRLASDAATRNPGRAAAYAERMLPLARKVRHHGTMIQAALQSIHSGDYGKGENILAEVERILDAYPAGIDQRVMRKQLYLIRSESAWVRRAYSEGLAAIVRARAAAPNLLAADAEALALERRLEVRSGRRSPEHLRWARALRSNLAREWIAAADILLLGGDRPGAARAARRAIELAQTGSLLLWELEAALLLHRADGDRLVWERCLDLARQLGFDPPESFGGRRDLLELAR